MHIGIRSRPHKISWTSITVIPVGLNRFTIKMYTKIQPTRSKHSILELWAKKQHQWQWPVSKQVKTCQSHEVGRRFSASSRSGYQSFSFFLLHPPEKCGGIPKSQEHVFFFTPVYAIFKRAQDT